MTELHHTELGFTRYFFFLLFYHFLQDISSEAKFWCHISAGDHNLQSSHLIWFHRGWQSLVSIFLSLTIEVIFFKFSLLLFMNVIYCKIYCIVYNHYMVIWFMKYFSFRLFHVGLTRKFYFCQALVLIFLGIFII